jgi:hypothetical protein
MSIFALIMTIVKELMPFLKESLLEGQTFRAWVKTNWLTFAWLVNALIMTLMIAHLADTLHLTRVSEQKARQEVQSIKQPAEKLVVLYKGLKAENARLAQDINTLRNGNQQKDLLIAQYEDWMKGCGVNLETGQCRVVRAPIVKPTPRPKSRPKSVPKQPAETAAQPEPEQKTGFLKKLRNIFTREKKADQ